MASIICHIYMDISMLVHTKMNLYKYIDRREIVDDRNEYVCVCVTCVHLAIESYLYAVFGLSTLITSGFFRLSVHL